MPVKTSLGTLPLRASLRMTGYLAALVGSIIPDAAAAMAASVVRKRRRKRRQSRRKIVSDYPQSRLGTGLEEERSRR
jgi:anti-sigma factor RsiW